MRYEWARLLVLLALFTIVGFVIGLGVAEMVRMMGG
jgi:hypothetical protein